MTESDNADLFEAEGKSILQFLNVFITICAFKEDRQIAKKFNLSSRNVHKLRFFFVFFLNPMSVSWPQWEAQKRPGAAFIITDLNSSRT